MDTTLGQCSPDSGVKRTTSNNPRIYLGSILSKIGDTMPHENFLPNIKRLINFSIPLCKYVNLLW